MSNVESATQETTNQAAAESGCTGCGACGDACESSKGEQQPAGEMPAELKSLIGGLGGAIIGGILCRESAKREDDGSKLDMASLDAARAYLASLYKPQPLDVVRLNANGRVFTDFPGDAEVAVVARVLDKPVFSAKASHHSNYAGQSADCTLLLCHTDAQGVQAFTEMLFSSVYLELAN